jgi:sugar O-acyltransferase (sialic acid O-acetyltransferase NeuD family)
MNREKVLIGAGGFAREVKAHMKTPNMKCYVDDIYYNDNDENIHPLSTFDSINQVALVVVGNPIDRHNIVKRLPAQTEFFTFIHPSAQILGDDVEIGEGSIICAGSVITTNVKIGKHTHLNLLTTIGHDCRIGDYFTTAPGVKISGNCNIKDRVYFGTNASIKEKLDVCENVTIGLMSGVVKHIDKSGTYIGTPAKLITDTKKK